MANRLQHQRHSRLGPAAPANRRRPPRPATVILGLTLVSGLLLLLASAVATFFGAV